MEALEKEVLSANFAAIGEEAEEEEEVVAEGTLRSEGGVESCRVSDVNASNDASEDIPEDNSGVVGNRLQLL